MQLRSLRIQNFVDAQFRNDKWPRHSLLFRLCFHDGQSLQDFIHFCIQVVYLKLLPIVEVTKKSAKRGSGSKFGVIQESAARNGMISQFSMPSHLVISVFPAHAQNSPK